MVETPIFIPFTQDSELRKRLQAEDDVIGEATGSPGVRFVERCGGDTIVSLLESSNPWAKDWSCGRGDCLPCKGRAMLASEVDQRPVPLPEEVPHPRPSKEETRTSPKCITEGVGYINEGKNTGQR